MNNIIREVRNELENQTDDKTKSNFQRFFKEEVKYHGVKAAIVVKMANNIFLR